MAEADASSPLDDLLGGRPARGWRRWLSWGLVLVAAIALGILLIRFVVGDDSPYIVAAVEQGDLQPRVIARGRLRPTATVQVGAAVPGVVTYVAALDDGRVAPEQALARIDPSELRQRVGQARIAIDAARADAQRAEAAIAQTRAQLFRIESVFRRSRGRVPSRSELETARADAQRAVADFEAAQVRVREAEAQLEADRERLTKAIIRSPVAGMVIDQRVRTGQFVDGPEEPLFVLATDLERMAIDVPVDQARIGDVRQGMPARIAIDAFPDRIFRGTVAKVGFAPSTAGDQPSSSYPVTVLVPNDELLLRPGMAATVQIDLTPRENVLHVPDAALRFDPASTAIASRNTSGRDMIHVLTRDGSVEPVEVTVGASDGGRTEVGSDTLASGMAVIVGWRRPPLSPASRERNPRERNAGNETPANETPETKP